MKKLIILGWAGLLVTSIPAQTIINPKTSGLVPGRSSSGTTTSFQITESGADYRIWQRTNYQANAASEQKAQTHRIVELATGLNYQDATSGQWLPAKEEIDAYPGGAIAQFGQHKVIFANNLNSAGAIDLKMSDGGEMQSDVLGLSYYDSVSGKSVLIAEVKDCQGEIVDQNQVIYTNAFDHLNADVRYTYTKAGLEQDVILLEQPSSPESYGLSSVSTVLQVLTEFTSAPTPAIKHLAGAADEDEILDFGAMKMIHGKAFLLGASSKATAVTKQWAVIGGRQILLESVHVSAIAQSLDQLPTQSSIQPAKSRTHYLVSNERQLPPCKTAKAAKGQMKLAGRTPLDHGLVLDFVDVDGSMGNVIFQGDTTYFISGPAYCDDVTLEGGTVIKYPNNTTAFLEVDGSLTCLTGPYRPALFTAVDDDSVGESFYDDDGPTGYTGTIQPGTYANPAIQFSGLMHDVRISYARQAAAAIYGEDITISDSQIIDCGQGVGLVSSYGGIVTLNNCLIGSPDILATNVLIGGGCDGAFNLYFCTVDNYSELTAPASDGTSPGNVYAVDSIFTDIGDFGGGSLSGGYNGFYNTPSEFGDSPTVDDNLPYTTYTAPEYTGDSGYYYLADSVFTGVTTSDPGYVSDPAVLADVSQKTIQIPYDCSWNEIGGEWGAGVSLDSSCSNLGYHHDRLDYLVSGTQVAGGTTTVDPGVVFGWYGNGLVFYTSNSVVNFNGTAANPCHFVSANTVLETSGGDTGVGISGTTANPSVVNASFTRFSAFYPSGDPYMGYSSCYFDVGYGNAITVSASNCEFWDDVLYNDIGGLSLNLFNCLLDRTTTSLWSYTASPTNSLSMANCTSIGGRIDIGRSPTGTLPLAVGVTNCAFDGTVTTKSASDYPYISGENNAYLSGGNRFTNETADISVSGGYNWQAGPLGNFYQATDSPLINVGSTTADQLGLYHYTVRCDLVNGLEVKETNSIVDIGYHYVATDAYGNPIDTTQDGIPDYLKDSNGDGIYDTGDLENWLVSPYNGLSTANGLSVFTPLK